MIAGFKPMCVGEADAIVRCIDLCWYKGYAWRINQCDGPLDWGKIDAVGVDGVIALVVDLEAWSAIESNHLSCSGAQQLTRERDVAATTLDVLKIDAAILDVNMASEGNGVGSDCGKRKALNGLVVACRQGS